MYNIRSNDISRHRNCISLKQFNSELRNNDRAETCYTGRWQASEKVCGNTYSRFWVRLSHSLDRFRVRNAMSSLAYISFPYARRVDVFFPNTTCRTSVRTFISIDFSPIEVEFLLVFRIAEFRITKNVADENKNRKREIDKSCIIRFSEKFKQRSKLHENKMKKKKTIAVQQQPDNEMYTRVFWEKISLIPHPKREKERKGRVYAGLHASRGNKTLKDSYMRARITNKNR